MALLDFENSSAMNNSDYSDSFEVLDHSWIFAARVIRTVCIPLIGCVGLIGNTLCLFVFSAKSMKKSSCSVFLASLAFVDNIFLVGMLLNWIEGEIHLILTNNIICQLLIFSTYLSSFLSVWFIVGFTCERYIAICFPLRSNYLCSVFREKIVVAAETLFAIGLYSFTFWTTDLQSSDESVICSHKPEFINFLKIVTWIDSIVTMILPFCLIVTMNMMVLRTVMKCPRAGRSKRHYSIVLQVSQNCYLNEERVKMTKIEKQQIQVTTRTQRKNPQFRVTRTLLFVSFTFLFLNLPSHAMRLYNLIISLTSQIPTISERLYFLQELTYLLYYTTFSCNFFLYTFFGRNFKKALYSLLRCKSAVELQRTHMLHRLSSTQGITQRSRETSL